MKVAADATQLQLATLNKRSANGTRPSAGTAANALQQLFEQSSANLFKLPDGRSPDFWRNAVPKLPTALPLPHCWSQRGSPGAWNMLVNELPAA